MSGLADRIAIGLNSFSIPGRVADHPVALRRPWRPTFEPKFEVCPVVIHLFEKKSKTTGQTSNFQNQPPDDTGSTNIMGLYCPL